MGSANTQATRSTLQSVDTTLSENINATQNYIPVASTTNFSTSVVAEIESTNEVVSFSSITENLFLHSQDFKQTSYWSYNNSNIEATLYTAPDGTTTANGFTEDSSSVSHNIIRNSLTTVIGQKYTISIFAKWIGRRYIQISFGSGDTTPNLAFQNFDIETGVLGSSFGVTNSAITDVGNGWYRCSIVVESAVTTGFIPVLGLTSSTTSGRSPSYPGQGNGAGAQLYIWGAQFEEGDSLTGYLPTTTSSLQGLTTVTRGANGTTAQAASSGDSIQQLPFAFQQVLATVTSTLSENIDATQNYVPVASTSGFVTGVNATIESTNEVVSFNDLSENLVEYSQDFNNSYWTKRKTTITANTSIAPDGTNTADTFTANANTNTFYNIKSDATFTTGVNHTFSVHVKAGTYSFVSIGTSDTFSFSSFDISNGTIIVSNSRASIEDKGNGWYRCTVKNLTPGGAQSIFIQFCDASGNTTLTLTGSETLLLWGAQMELGANIVPPTTYLPTSGSALVGLTGVTRGVNGTTAQAASSGASISQTPSLGSLDMPVRLRAISVSPDGTGNARLTLCDNNGDTLCDVDIPNAKSYTFNMPEEGIIFPNGVFISNTDNITAYTVYTEKYSGPSLTS